MSITKIRFEDHGQDFLEWVLDEKGQVAVCKPFHDRIWKGAKVINHKELQHGDFVRVLVQINGEDYAIRIEHPIETIEHINEVTQ